MRKAITIVAVVALFSSMASAQMFYPTRDAAINREPTEMYASGGAMSEARPAKYRQHYFLMDFDWAAIEAAGATYASPVYLFSMVAEVGDDRLDGIRARIVISSNDVDWVEADGNDQFLNFTWTDPTVNYAVTTQYAQTIALDNPDYNPDYDPEAPVGSPDPYIIDDINSVGPWPWNDFDGMRNVFMQYNILPLVFGLGGVRVEVDMFWIMPGLFSGTCVNGLPIRGIYTFDMDNAGNNGEAYLSNAGTDLSPRIEVMPEPASLLLIAFGGVGLLLRKKR